jgi:cytochrome P450
MGSDVSCLAGEGTVVNGRYTLPDIEFARAFDTLNNICASRQSKPMWEISEKLDGTSAKLKWSQDVLDGFSRKVIAKKRADRSKSGGGPSGPSDDKNADLLDHFLSVKHDDGSELSDIELVDIVRNFIVAGRDTTAQTLTWVWYRLAANPEV